MRTFYQTTTRGFLACLQSTMTALTATRTWSPARLRWVHLSGATHPAFRLSGAVSASCWSESASKLNKNKTAIYRAVCDFCDRCELPRTPSGQMLRGSDEPAACGPGLSAWELWLVRKAKEDRLNMQKKAKEASSCLIV